MGPDLEHQDKANLGQVFGTIDNAVLRLLFEEETEEGAMVASVGLARNEAVGWDDVTTAAGVRAEQREDDSLREDWSQAVEGTHGRKLQDRLLVHEKKINGQMQNQLVLPESKSERGLELAHDRSSGGRLSEEETKHRSARLRFQVPETKKDRRNVIGLSHYREHTEYFEVMCPLSDLHDLGIPKSIPRNEEARNAFCAVKNVLASLPQVVASGHCHDFLLMTDASEVPERTCISQLVKVERTTVAISSKKPTVAQANWLIMERDMLRPWGR